MYMLNILHHQTNISETCTMNTDVSLNQYQRFVNEKDHFVSWLLWCIHPLVCNRGPVATLSSSTATGCHGKQWRKAACIPRCKKIQAYPIVQHEKKRLWGLILYWFSSSYSSWRKKSLFLLDKNKINKNQAILQHRDFLFKTVFTSLQD